MVRFCFALRRSKELIPCCWNISESNDDGPSISTSQQSVRQIVEYSTFITSDSGADVGMVDSDIVKYIYSYSNIL